MAMERNASELLEAANSFQGPSPFPAPTPTPAMPAANGDIKFDFRPYLLLAMLKKQRIS